MLALPSLLDAGELLFSMVVYGTGIVVFGLVLVWMVAATR